MAGFQVSINGRFWVSTEDEREAGDLIRTIRQIDDLVQLKSR